MADNQADINIGDSGILNLTADQLTGKTFISLLIKRLGFLLLKLVGSRTAWFITLDKLLGVALMVYFGQHSTFPINFVWAMIAIYGISVIITLIYINELNFKPVETKISLGNKTGE